MYVCRTDGVDLTAEVERACADKGGHTVSVDVLVEGFSSGQETFIEAEVARARDDLDKVHVTCPKDNTENIFWACRRDE